MINNVYYGLLTCEFYRRLYPSYLIDLVENDKKIKAFKPVLENGRQYKKKEKAIRRLNNSLKLYEELKEYIKHFNTKTDEYHKDLRCGFYNTNVDEIKNTWNKLLSNQAKEICITIEKINNIFNLFKENEEKRGAVITPDGLKLQEAGESDHDNDDDVLEE